ncbi:MAG TPA: 3-hydroxyacyl-CoA dehydrogenase NAD-binding domain-containing protein, partial [Piscinibacter sp.]|nr:3-hydroxyacyl-CoA dehydrogenase NAD-binding domain-containing protein [Piscinibacter sp.]
MTATYQTRGDVAVITLANPPVNGLGYETRLGIVNGLEQALNDAAVKAIVITGAGKAFSGGADIREFGSPKAVAEPNLLSVILALEASSKPIVAAIHSVAMGGGLELALGCHYRVTAPGAQIALPEVKIGLIPGAGGTQRLPRVLGLENALNMIVSGEPVASELLAKAPGQKLFDKLIEGDLMEGAIAFAREVADKRPLPLVRKLEVDHPNPQAYLQFARNTVGAMAKNFPAPPKCVDAVAASTTMKFDAGMKYEREIFTALMFTPECKALRHAFMAERATTKIPDVPADTPVRDVKKLAVIGAGTMGGGIAMNFLNAGLSVVMLEMKQEALDRGVATIRKNYEAQVKKGKLKQDKYEQRMALLSTTLSYADLKDADMVIEAVFEDMAVKEQVFKTLDEVMKPGAILASNTSTLDVNKIAAFTKRPQDVIGTHFFSPANVMKLLEVVRGEKTAKDVLATVMALGKKIKKTCVVSGVCDGFIGNRMIEQYSRQAGFLLEEGATPQQVDKAIEKFGFAMGPFRMGDLAGNDVGWYIRKRRYLEKPNLRYSKTADLLCEMGRFGQKTQAGWYDYVAGKRDAIPSKLVEDMIARHRTELGIAPRKISDEEIVQRLVFALV